MTCLAFVSAMGWSHLSKCSQGTVSYFLLSPDCRTGLGNGMLEL